MSSNSLLVYGCLSFYQPYLSFEPHNVDGVSTWTRKIEPTDCLMFSISLSDSELCLLHGTQTIVLCSTLPTYLSYDYRHY